MARNNSVYDNLLKNYQKVRGAKKEKEQNAANKIAEAEKSIEENKAMMAKAIASGNQERYTELYEANTKNEASISFFKGVLDMLKRDDSCDLDGKELQRNANAEIAKIIEQYNEEFLKLLQPVIELSANTCEQVNLLRLAKTMIAKNIDGADDSSISWNDRHFGYENMELMAALDKMLQSEPFKRTSGFKLGTTVHGIPRYEWDGEAYKKYNSECAKWM